MLSECRLQPKQASTEGENDSRFLVVSQNSRGVTGSELHRPPTSPRGPPDPTPVAAPPAQSHSTTYTHAGPYCTSLLASLPLPHLLHPSWLRPAPYLTVSPKKAGP